MGFSQPERPLYFDRFCEWIDAGNQADMQWMGKHLDLRENPEKLLNNCKTVISLAYPYSSKKPLTPDGFSVARYNPLKMR